MTTTVRRVGALALLCLAVGVREAHCQKVLAEAIPDLAARVAASMTEERRHRVAILPFRELDGRVTVLGTYVSEELVTHLFAIGGLEIVERTLLDRLLGELTLGRSGVIDQETARQVGKVAGVDAIVSGTITDLDSYVSLNCRLMDAETGRVFAAAQTKIVKDDDVRKIMAASPAAQQPASGAPTQPDRPVASDEESPGLQRVDGLAFDLQECGREGTSVVCDLLITNEDVDRHLDADPRRSRFFDAQGNEYYSTGFRFGTARAASDRTLPGFGRGSGTTLVAGIPVRARVTFAGVPAGLDRATLLEIVTRGPSVQYRDVALGRP